MNGTRTRFGAALGATRWATLGATTVLALATAAGGALEADILPRERTQEAEVLLLMGGVRDGEMSIDPAFVYEGRVRLPEAPGPYSLRGLDGEGETLFSLSFTPHEIDHGGSGFSFSIAFEPAWTEALDRIEVRGPEGVATVDRVAGGRAMLIIDRATGQVRSILRDGSGGLPAALAADSAGLEIIRGLPRRPSDGVSLIRAGRTPLRVRPASRPGSSVGRATDF